MEVENLVKSKYKIFLKILKILPVILAGSAFINSIMQILGIESIIFSILFRTSLVPALFILITSSVFEYCNYHKMLIYYIMLIELLNLIDYIFTIPLNMHGMLSLILIITAIFLFIILYLYVANNKKAFGRTA